MKPRRSSLIAPALILILVIGVVYSNRAELKHLWQRAMSRVYPCRQPIRYSIGSIDPRFGLTTAEVLADVSKAEQIWESSIDRELFTYSPTGELQLNFVYDYRQQATVELKKIGIVINNDRSSYDSLKAKYDALLKSYQAAKAKLESDIASYEATKNDYERQVSYWNDRGGAPKEEFQSLQQQRADLNNQATAINQEENSFNDSVNTIRSVEASLNQLVSTLNLQVDQYNAVGSSTGAVFNEGEYSSSVGTATINIFQFNDDRQLVRVLTHELGHALGLKHLNNPQAIMYYLNEGGNDQLTSDDLAALKSLCRIKWLEASTAAKIKLNK